MNYVKPIIPNTYYAYTYPTKSNDECVLIVLHGGMPTRDTGVRQPTLQFLVRGNVGDVQTAEAKAYELYEEFKYKKDVMIGDWSVSKIQALQSQPIWTGTDEAKRPIFSLNFQLTIRG
ncbi:minor capsid protein [Bacillus cereus]|uniref:minor capsid protein n=1 Tax=Bacillus cereus TaxID=1396 RepID=UPI001F0A0A5F|nr:minor capsid protein [Bacillus cereus]